MRLHYRLDASGETTYYDRELDALIAFGAAQERARNALSLAFLDIDSKSWNDAATHATKQRLTAQSPRFSASSKPPIVTLRKEWIR